MVNLLTFDMNLLRVLDALLAEHSTTRAAERLGLSQSAVSAALGRLRHALNDPLFVRQGQRIVPTPFCASLEVPLRQILDDIAATLSAGQAFDPARAKQNFKLSGSDFFAELLMPRLAEHLSRRAPNITVQLVDLVPDNHVARVESLDIDLVLIPTTTFPEWIDHVPVLRSGFVVVARRDHPRLNRAEVAPGEQIPLDLFCDLGHVAFSTEGRLQVMGDAALARVGRSRQVVMTLPFMQSVLSAVARSDLIALTPHQLAHHLSDRMGLEIYTPPVTLPTVELRMAWHRRSTTSPAHRWLRQLVADLLAEL